MKLRSILREELEITEDLYRILKNYPEHLKWCEDNASEYMKNSQKLYTFIYKGFDSQFTDDLPTIKNSGDITRISQNTFNYYTLWIDNHPDWKDFPKRSKSFICTSNEHVARGFGSRNCIMIPEDTAKIGICPETDFWENSYIFDIFKSTTGTISDISDVMSVIHKTIRECTKIEVKTYEDLVKALDQITLDSIIDTREVLEKQNEGKPAYTWSYYELTTVIEAMKNNHTNKLLNLFRLAFDPEKGKFRHCLANRFAYEKNIEDVEVWVQGKVLIIPADSNDVKKNHSAFSLS